MIATPFSFRLLLRNRAYIVWSIIGLVIGFGMSLYLFSYYLVENSYNSFHSKGSMIYSIHTQYNNPTGAPTDLYPPSEFYGLLRSNFKGGIKCSRLRTQPIQFVKSGDNTIRAENLILVDSAFFAMFDFPLKSGEFKSGDGNQVVVSEKLASKFPSSNPLGELIEINGKEFTISGILKDLPGKSTIEFDIISSTTEADSVKWDRSDAIIFVELEGGTNIHSITSSLKKAINNYYQTNEAFSVKSISLREQYFENPFIKRLGDKSTVNILLAVSILIVIISLINYLNQTTLLAIKRSKEIAIRRINGATAIQLRLQFFFESLFILTGSAIVAFLLFHTLTRSFNAPAQISYIPIDVVVLAVIMVITISSFIVTIYPLHISTTLNLSTFLRGKPFSGSSKKIRASLVIFQLTLSIVFIVYSLTIWWQQAFMSNKDLGFTMDNVLTLDFQKDNMVESDLFASSYKAFKNEVMGYKSIQGISINSMFGSFSRIVWNQGDSKPIDFIGIRIDEQFLASMGIELIQGENLTDPNITDRVIANEKAFSILSQKGIRIGDNLPFLNNRRLVGVVKDFNIFGLNLAIQPLIMEKDDNESFSTINIKYSGSQKEVESLVESKWKKYSLPSIGELKTFREKYTTTYLSQKDKLTFWLASTVTALIVSCIGTLNFIVATINSRRKEMSLRKYFGASGTNIILLYLFEVVPVFVIASVIALPIAAYFNEDYLNQFAYRTETGVGLYVLGLTILILVLILAISFETIKASAESAIVSLREN